MEHTANCEQELFGFYTGLLLNSHFVKFLDNRFMFIDVSVSISGETSVSYFYCP